eukprot:5064321-Alexandrium_andersonii.AAC.1
MLEAVVSASCSPSTAAQHRQAARVMTYPGCYVFAAVLVWMELEFQEACTAKWPCPKLGEAGIQEEFGSEF